jgi:hypothetical protein
MSTVTPAWMKGVLGNFYNIETLRGTRVSDQASWNLAVTASGIVAVACIGTWAKATTTRASPATAGPTSC